MTGGLIRSSHCTGHQKSQFHFFPFLNSTGRLWKDAQTERWATSDGETRMMPAVPALGASGSEPSSQPSGRSGGKGWVTSRDCALQTSDPTRPHARIHTSTVYVSLQLTRRSFLMEVSRKMGSRGR